MCFNNAGRFALEFYMYIDFSGSRIDFSRTDLSLPVQHLKLPVSKSLMFLLSPFLFLEGERGE